MYVPRFQYPVAGTTLTLTQPMRHWERRQNTVGGWRQAASGVIAARTIRRDYLLDLILRVDESELASVETMIAWMQDNPSTAFTFWPDTDVGGTSFSSLLISPLPGEELRAPRASEFASTLEVALTIRRSTGATWPLAWYPD